MWGLSLCQKWAVDGKSLRLSALESLLTQGLPEDLMEMIFSRTGPHGCLAKRCDIARGWLWNREARRCPICTKLVLKLPVEHPFHPKTKPSLDYRNIQYVPTSIVRKKTENKEPLWWSERHPRIQVRKSDPTLPLHTSVTLKQDLTSPINWGKVLKE